MLDSSKLSLHLNKFTLQITASVHRHSREEDKDDDAKPHQVLGFRNLQSKCNGFFGLLSISQKSITVQGWQVNSSFKWEHQLIEPKDLSQGVEAAQGRPWRGSRRVCWLGKKVPPPLWGWEVGGGVDPSRGQLHPAGTWHRTGQNNANPAGLGFFNQHFDVTPPQNMILLCLAPFLNNLG